MHAAVKDVNFYHTEITVKGLDSILFSVNIKSSLRSEFWFFIADNRFYPFFYLFGIKV